MNQTPDQTTPIIGYRQLHRRSSPQPGRRPTPRRPKRTDTIAKRVRRLVLLLRTWLIQGRVASLCLLGWSLWGLWFLFTSPTIRIRTVTVEGATILTPDQVRELAAVDGLSPWWLSPDSLAEQLLQNAYIEHATVTIHLPDQVAIHVTERRPEVRWMRDGISYLVDRHGTVLSPTDEPPAPDTLIIHDTSPGTLYPNQRVDPDAIALARALALRLPHDLEFSPTLIGWDLGLGIFLQTPTDQTVVFGRSDNLSHKLAMLQHLQRDQTAYTFLDLRPARPYYRPPPPPE